MAGPDPPGQVGVPKGAARQPLGAIGEASQVVEAALQARTAASEDQRFATTKTLFFALSSLGGALMLELRLKTVGQVIGRNSPLLIFMVCVFVWSVEFCDH